MSQPVNSPLAQDPSLLEGKLPFRTQVKNTAAGNVSQPRGHLNFPGVYLVAK